MSSTTGYRGNVEHGTDADRADHHRHPLANRAVLALLHSRAHRLVGDGLCELRYAAPLAGHDVCFPVMYARLGAAYVVLAGNARDKRWWRVFRTPWPVEVRRGDTTETCFGRVLSDQDPLYPPAFSAYLAAQHHAPAAADRLVVIEPIAA